MMQKSNDNKIETQLSRRSMQFDGKNTLLGMLLALASTVAFSFMSLFVSLMSGSVPSFEIAFFRFLAQGLGAILTIAFTRSDKHELRTWLGKRENWLKLFRRGAWGICGLTSWFYSLQHLDLSDATCIFFAQVPITSILATFVLKEPYTKADFYAAISCVIGMILVIQPAFLFGGGENHKIDPFALCVCIFGACCASMVYISVRRIGSREDPLVIVLWFSVMGTMATPILTALFQSFVLPTGSKDIWLIVGMGIVGYIGQITLNRGLQLAPAGPASLMRYGDIVFAIVFQSFIIKEVPGTVKILGALLILATVFAALYKMKKKAKADKLAKEREAAVNKDAASSISDKPSAPLHEVKVVRSAPMKQSSKYMKFDADEGSCHVQAADGVTLCTGANSTSDARASSHLSSVVPAATESNPGVAESLVLSGASATAHSVARGNTGHGRRSIVVAFANKPTVDSW